MTTVARLREMLAYCPGDWEVQAWDDTTCMNMLYLYERDAEFTEFSKEVCMVDLDNEELNPIRPLKVYVNNDGSTTPLGLMDEDEHSQLFMPSNIQDTKERWHEHAFSVSIEEQEKLDEYNDLLWRWDQS